MAEVEALLCAVAGELAAGKTEHLSYREAFLCELALDPFAATLRELALAAESAGFSARADEESRDDLLDFLMACRVGPNLGRHGLTFIYGYPASQAALARLDPHDARTALRFELYRHGVELANGYHELCSPEKQRARFTAENAERRRRGLPAVDVDEHLLASLKELPDCAGVALGLDRVLMLASGAAHINEVIAFPTGQA